MKTTKNTLKKQQKTVTITAEEYEQLKFRAEQAEQKLRLLEESIRLNRKKMYGKSSEKTNPQYEQLSLFFDEVETTATIEIVEEKETKVASHTRKPKKMLIDKENLPKHLPIETVEHGLTEAERLCPECGTIMQQCGQQEKYELKIVPASYSLVKHVYYTYNCPDCKVNSDKDKFKKTPTLPQLIEGSFASPEAVAYVMIQKYVMHTPLYRLEQELKSQGLNLSRQTMCNWVIKVAETMLMPIYDMLHARLLTKQILHADETTLQVLNEKNKTAKSKSFMWLYRTGKAEDEQIVLYEYKPDRKSCNPKAFLNGFNGFLHVDGYNAYTSLDATARNVGCLAHARRKLVEAQAVATKGSEEETAIKQGMRIFMKIAAFEREVANLTPEERHKLRTEKLVPIISELEKWRDEQANRVFSKSKFGTALTYLKNQWAYLVRFLEDGRLEATNNLAERSIKPFVIGRKNWLFSDNVRGATASATIFSLIETAKANGIDPYSYLLYIFKQVPTLKQESDEWVKKFMPEVIPDYCRMKIEE